MSDPDQQVQPLRLLDTASKTLQVLTPEPGQPLKIYCCGITPYAPMHLGHLRIFYIMSILVRFLRFQGIGVRYVSNFTDLDDKIIQRAEELRIPVAILSKKYIDDFFTKLDIFELEHPDSCPTVTKSIREIVQDIQRLIQNGTAYQDSQGDVRFSIKEHQRRGFRYPALVPTIEKPEDFVLWKHHEKHSNVFPSSFGEGRPGWHIECSTFGRTALGYPIDLHVGGSDLIFPHHTNEIAQNEALIGSSGVRLWMHIGMLQRNNEKMSKSTNNLLDLNELLRIHNPAVIKLVLMNGAYQQPRNITDELFQEAITNHRLFEQIEAELIEAPVRIFNDHLFMRELFQSKLRIYQLLSDNLDTRAALHEFIRVMKSCRKQLHTSGITNGGKNFALCLMNEMDQLFGIIGCRSRSWFRSDGSTILRFCSRSGTGIRDIEQTIHH